MVNITKLVVEWKLLKIFGDISSLKALGRLEEF